MLIAIDQGAVSVNWSLFPVFVAQNNSLVKKVDRVLQKEFSGLALTREVEIALRERVFQLVEEEYHVVQGLDKYFDAIREVAFPAITYGESNE